MIVVEGASMAHVAWVEFWPLWGLSVVVAASRGFRLMRMFLGGR